MLWINDAHPAHDDDIRNAVDTAQQFFDERELDPAEVWIGYQKDNIDATVLWGDAELVAFQALFAGWREWPESASLVYE